MLHDEVDGHLVLAAARHDDVGVRHARRDVALVGGLHVRHVLLQHALQLAAALHYVPAATERLVAVDKRPFTSIPQIKIQNLKFVTTDTIVVVMRGSNFMYMG